MKRRALRRSGSLMPSAGVAVFGSAILGGIALSSFASCAENVNEAPMPEDAASAVPETSAPNEVVEAGGPDAGCDAADPSCTTEVVSCEEVDWCLVPTGVGVADMLMAVWGTSKNDVWAVGSGGTIIHYDGSSWTATPTDVLNTFHAIWGSGPDDVWVVSSTGVVLHGTGFVNGTASWRNVPTTVPPATQPIVRAIWGSSPDDVRIGGMTFRTTINGRTRNGTQFVKVALPDGGPGWRPLEGTGLVTSIWGASPDDVWMAADNSRTSIGTYYQKGLTFHGRPADGGADANAGDPLTWTPVDAQSIHTIEAIWGPSADDVWAVGGHGTIRRILEGDERWRKIESSTNQTLHAVWGSGPNDVWIVGDGGTILHYDGATLEESSAQLPLGPRPSLRGVWGSAPNDVWIVGDKVALHYTGPKKAKDPK